MFYGYTDESKSEWFAPVSAPSRKVYTTDISIKPGSKIHDPVVAAWHIVEIEMNDNAESISKTKTHRADIACLTVRQWADIHAVS